MSPQFSHELISSFYLWFEAKLLSANCFVPDQENSFEYVNFPDIPSSHCAYQGKFRQLVADQGISNPNSGIFINGDFITGSNSDIYIDYDNGRVIVPQSSGTSLNITANNTVKEINTYITDRDEEQLLLTSDFVDSSNTSSTFLFSKTSKRDKKTYILPACFIRFVDEENEEFSFGGEDDTKTRVRVVVLAKSNYIIDGVLSLFASFRDECITRIPYKDYPYGVFNCIKSFPYSYSDYSSAYQPKTYIERVKTAKLEDSISRDKIEKGTLIGFIDFDLSTYRYPRV